MLCSRRLVSKKDGVFRAIVPVLRYYANSIGQSRIPGGATHPAGRAVSPLGHMVADSAWEQYAANVFEKSNKIAAYAKNDQFGVWCSDVAFQPAQIQDIVQRHSA